MRKFVEQSIERITLLVSALTVRIVSMNVHATRKHREKSAIGEATSAVTSRRCRRRNVTDNARFITKFGDGETADYYSPRVVIFH